MEFSDTPTSTEIARCERVYKMRREMEDLKADVNNGAASEEEEEFSSKKKRKAELVSEPRHTAQRSRSSDEEAEF